MLRVLISAALLLLPLSAAAAELRGIAEVVDGDTLRIEGIPVRFNSIDAPETGQLCEREGRPWLCGDGSTEALRLLAEGREVVCITDGTDRYQRIVAECWVGEPDPAGTSLSTAMVRQRWTLDYTKYSKGRHATEQLQAEIEGVGLWSSAFLPWECAPPSVRTRNLSSHRRPR
jgi:endonuclease YncB( thermonuclease family)